MPAPVASRTEPRSRCASSSDGAKAKPVGPQELWPMPTAPSFGQPLGQGLDAFRGKDAALRRREMGADEHLDRRDGGAESGQGRARSGPASAPSAPAGRSLPRRLRERAAGRGRPRVRRRHEALPRLRRSMSRTRHSSGKGSRATTGGGLPLLSFPASTITPPLSKLAMPMPDRAPRASRVASPAISSGSPCSVRSAAATASAIWVPDPRPA